MGTLYPRESVLVAPVTRICQQAGGVTCAACRSPAVGPGEAVGSVVGSRSPTIGIVAFGAVLTKGALVCVLCLVASIAGIGRTLIYAADVA